MNIKRTLAAAAVTAAAATVVFGGSTVATAFNTSHDGSVTAKSADISDAYTGLKLALRNAIPGDTSAPQTVSYTNHGSVPMELTVTVGTPSGTGAAANVAALEAATNLTMTGSPAVPLSAVVAQHGESFALQSVAPGQSFSSDVTLAAH